MNFPGCREEQNRFIKNQRGAANATIWFGGTRICKGHMTSRTRRKGVPVPATLPRTGRATSSKATNVPEAREWSASYGAFVTLMCERAFALAGNPPRQTPLCSPTRSGDLSAGRRGRDPGPEARGWGERGFDRGGAAPALAGQREGEEARREAEAPRAPGGKAPPPALAPPVSPACWARSPS